MCSALMTETKANPKEDLLRSLEFCDWKNQVKTDSTVLIKPNFTFPYYKDGITTSTELLKHLLEIIKDRAVNVIAGEPDGGNHSFSANDTFKGHNWHEICKGTGVDFTKVNLSKLHSVFVVDNNIREESEGSFARTSFRRSGCIKMWF